MMKFEDFLIQYKEELNILRKHPLGTDVMDLLEESWNHGFENGYKSGYRSGHGDGLESGYDLGFIGGKYIAREN